LTTQALIRHTASIHQDWNLNYAKKGRKMSSYKQASDLCSLCNQPLPAHLKGGVHLECHRRQMEARGLEEPEIYERVVEREKREAAPRKLISGQQYRQVLRRTFGYDGDHEVFRLRSRLGNIQVEAQTSDCISLTFYPGGGRQPPAILPSCSAAFKS